MASIEINRSAYTTTSVQLQQSIAPEQPNNKQLIIGKILGNNLPSPASGYPQLQYYEPFQLPGYTETSQMMDYLKNLGLVYVNGVSFTAALPAPTSVTATTLVYATMPTSWPQFSNDLSGSITQGTAVGQFVSADLVGSNYVITMSGVTGTFTTTDVVSADMSRTDTLIPDTLKSDPIVSYVYHALISANQYLSNMTGDQAGVNPNISIVLLKASDTTNPADVFTNISTIWYKVISSPFPVSTDTDLTTGSSGSFVDYVISQNLANATANNQFGTIGIMGNITSNNTTITSLPNAVVNTENMFGLVSYPYDNSVNQGQMDAGICSASMAALIAAQTDPYAGASGAIFPSWFVPSNLSFTYNKTAHNPSVLGHGWIPVYISNGAATSDVTSSTLLFVPGTTVPATANWDLQSTQVIIAYKQLATQQLALNLNRKGTSSNLSIIRGQLIALAKGFQTDGMFYNVDANSQNITIVQDPANLTHFIVTMPISIVQNIYQLSLTSNTVQPLLTISLNA